LGKKGKRATEELELIEQFFVTLNATFQQVKVNNPSAKDEIVKKIEELLTLTSWQNAYEIERLLVEIYDVSTLEVEVDRRLVEVKTNLSENVSLLYENQVKDAKDEGKKRSILNRMLNDLQWNYANKEARRRYTREVSTKNGWAFIISMTIFGLIIGLGKLINWEGNLYYLAIALGAGLVGASFSMVVTSKSRLAASSFDELKGLRRIIYVVTRSLIGLGATLILYFILQAELLTGSIFPTFTPPLLIECKTNNVISKFIIFNIIDTKILNIDKFKETESSYLKTASNLLASDDPDAKGTLAVETEKFLTNITTFRGEKLQALTSELTNKLWVLADITPLLDFKNLALLIVWSIVAGFSEKFVPNLLVKAEEKATVK
jgi:hypothetical protein